MGTQTVTLEFNRGIAVLTLNRPDSLNAMSQSMMRALESRLVELASLDGLRVVILTGAGRAFSAGGDLVEFEAALNAGGQTLIDYLRYNMGVLQMLEDLPVPVIAAINGTAVAGGLETLLCCDILVAAKGAKIGDGHTRYGVVPAAGATVRLSERISPSRASELFYTARLVDAGTLRDWGLINEIVPVEHLMDRAMEIATDISQRSPEAIGHIKFLMGQRARDADRHNRIASELERFAIHLDGKDLAAGLAAFREKRPPVY